MDYRGVLLSVVVLGAGIGGVTTACSSPDPGEITFSERAHQESAGTGTSGGSTPSAPTTPMDGGGGGEGGGAKTAAQQNFETQVYPGLSGTCAGCHAAAPNPVLFGADAASSYTAFKGLGFDKANSTLLTKGLHEGPALTGDQTNAINAWIALEGQGGG